MSSELIEAVLRHIEQTHPQKIAEKLSEAIKELEQIKTDYESSVSMKELVEAERELTDVLRGLNRCKKIVPLEGFTRNEWIQLWDRFDATRKQLEEVRGQMK